MVGTEAGRLGAVWSHVLLCEALAEERPSQFIDESERLPLEPLEMDELRLFGIGRVLRAAVTAPELTGAGFMDAFAGANELAPGLSYPQPCLQAMLVSQGAGTRFLVHVPDEQSARIVMSLARRIGHGQRCLCVQADSEDPLQEILASKARDPVRSSMMYLGTLGEDGQDADGCLDTLCERDGDGGMAWLEAPFRDAPSRDALVARIDAARARCLPETPWWIGELRLRHPFPGIFGSRVHAGCIVVATGLQRSTREWLTAMSIRLSDAYRDARLPDGRRGDLSFCLLADSPGDGPGHAAFRRARPGLPG
jgi:hypothetical protein